MLESESELTVPAEVYWLVCVFCLTMSAGRKFGFMELLRCRWTSFQASSGPCLDIRKYSIILGADDAGPASFAVPSELEDSVSLDTNNGEGGP
jgi:hypothetical protein